MYQSWYRMIVLARAAGGIFLLTAIVLTVVPQTEDMLAGTFDGPTLAGVWAGIAFHFCLFVLCFSLWYWSRAVLSARFDISDTETMRAARAFQAASRGDTVNLFAFEHLPRWLFVGGAAAGMLAAARSSLWVQSIVIALWSAAAYYGLVERRKWGVRAAAARTPSRTPAWLTSGLQPVWSGCARLLNHAPFGPWAAGSLLALTIILMLIGTLGTFLPFLSWGAWPLVLGTFFPGPSATLLFLGLTIGPLTLITFLIDESEIAWRIGPVTIHLRDMPALLLLAVIMTFTPVFFNLHAVRIASGNTLDPIRRASLPEFFEAWSKTCAAKDGAVRPVIVAVSGGASRAGLWAARVLTKVDAAARHAHTSVFAISSVSGGSLGAAAYVALRSSGRSCTLPPLDTPQRALRDAALVETMRADALGPALAGSLFGDMPRALFGAPAILVRRIYETLTGQSSVMRGGDRAEALELAFEANWERQRRGLGAVPGFENGFLSLFYTGGQPRGDVPLWIANGADAQNGNRLLTVPFESKSMAVPGGSNGYIANSRSERAWRGRWWPFLGSEDVLALLGHDVAISTAITNTARFPFLSPAGELTPAAGTQKHPSQIVDGGYFENEGLQTALELAQWLRFYGRRLIGRPVAPIIVQATADADSGANASIIVHCGDDFIDDPHLSHGRGRPLQLLAPLQGVYSARSGHADASLRSARAQYCTGRRGQSFFHFYLFRPGGTAVPLNWVLSRPIAYTIWEHGLDDSYNRSQMRKLMATLHGKPEGRRRANR